MRVKRILDEDFTNYRVPAMFIGSCACNWKCCLEAGIDVSVCQNHPLKDSPDVDVSPEQIYDRYISNPITSSIVFGGLEPMLQFQEMLDVIKYFRTHGVNDDIVIYTGYYDYEIEHELDYLMQFDNIIVKFGRFVPNGTPRVDEVLGVSLISSNQYAKKIS